MRQPLALLAASCLAGAAPPALAQAQGAFPAAMVCDAAGAAGRERATFAVELGPDGRASYRVKLGAAPAEVGTGRLAGRVLTLSGSAVGSYTARYTGEITGRGGVLAGTQTPARGGKPRACQIKLGDG